MSHTYIEDCHQIEPTEKSPAHHVFNDTLRELYWSKNQVMRTLLRLQNVALNAQLKRNIHDYFEASRIQVYTIEHLFELLDESPGGRVCSLTEVNCRKALAICHPEKPEGKDKDVRLCVAEFYAQEITILGYLFKLALSMGRLDIARITSDMRRKTHTAFEFAFPAMPANPMVAA